MATYADIYTLQSNTALSQRVSTALLVSSVAIYEENPATVNHTARVAWARYAALNMDLATAAMFKFLLGKFVNMTVTNIQNSTDAQIQTVVDNAVNLFATGF